MKCGICKKEAKKLWICNECDIKFCKKCGDTKKEICKLCLQFKSNNTDNEIRDN